MEKKELKLVLNYAHLYSFIYAADRTHSQPYNLSFPQKKN